MPRLRHLLRDLLTWTTIILVLGALLGVAWLSRNPESPHLEAAQDWPVVGELAERFREAYLGSPSSAAGRKEAREGKTEVVVIRQPVEEPIRLPQTRRPAGGPDEATPDRELAARAGLRLAPEGGGSASPSQPEPSPAPLFADWEDAYSELVLERDWFLPDQPIHAGADSATPVKDRLGSISYLPVLTYGEGWVKVRYQGEEGWIDRGWKPGHPKKGAKRGILRRRRDPTERRDHRAVSLGGRIMGIEGAKGDLAGYKLYSDVEDGELLAFVEGAAEIVEEAFFSRYGRIPSWAATHGMLIFAEHADYRRFSVESGHPRLSGHTGHARAGLVVTFVGERTRRQVARTVVHEITHLLVRRAMGYGIPAWLNEGMATDLGSLWVEGPPDRLTPGPGGGLRFSIVLDGDRAAHLNRLATSGRLLPLGALSVPTKDFYAGRLKGQRYSQSAALIQFLLEGEKGAMASGFRTFLKEIAHGESADLLASVGRDAAALERSFHRWIRREAERTEEERKRRLREALGHDVVSVDDLPPEARRAIRRAVEARTTRR